jgi:hypothetical protein
MKLVRPISAIPLLFLLSVGLFAMQQGGLRFGRRQQQFSSYYGQTVPSEFYWSRLQYNTLYGGGGFRGYGGGWRRTIPGPTTIASLRCAA